MEVRVKRRDARTLWENNIYFERAFEQCADFLAHSTFAPRQGIRERPGRLLVVERFSGLREQFLGRRRHRPLRRRQPVDHLLDTAVQELPIGIHR